MDKNFPAGKEPEKSSETGFQKTIYVPEEQQFQRIPLCRYLSDLSELFETETTEDEPTEKPGEEE